MFASLSNGFEGATLTLKPISFNTFCTHLIDAPEGLRVLLLQTSTAVVDR